MTQRADPWQLHIPWVFRTLADASLLEVMPRPVDGTLEQACASWGALHYTLTNLLGWSDPAVGLAWWYSAGQPKDDSPVLALVKEVWGRDDLIDYYAAWAWRSKTIETLAGAEAASITGDATWLAHHTFWNREEWWRSFLRRGSTHRHDAFHGGADPLHLAAHSGMGSCPSPERVVQRIDSKRQVILITGGLDRWLADLEQLERTLPSLGHHSWHVDVFDRAVGWLGEFRQSRVSGRWFLGQHGIHMRGAHARVKS